MKKIIFFQKGFGYVLFLGIVFLRILYLYFNLPADEIAASPDYWNQIAVSLFTGNGYAVSGTFITFRGPGYPMFLLLIYNIFGYNFIVGLVFQCILEGFIGLIIYYFIYNKTNNYYYSIIGGLAYMVYLPQYGCITSLFSDYFYTLLILLSLYYFAFHRKSKYNLYFSSCFLGLASLTRPEGFFFVFIIVFYLMITKRIKKSIKYFVVFVIIISPWILYSSINIGKVNIITQSGGYNLLNKNYVVQKSDFFDFKYDKVYYSNYLDSLFIVEGKQRGENPSLLNDIETYDKIGKEEFRKMVFEKPVKLTLLFILKFLHHSFGIDFFSNPTRIDLDQFVFNTSLIIIFILTLSSLLTSKNRDIFIILVLYIIYHLLLHIISNPQSRNNIHIIPLYIIMATCGAFYKFHSNYFNK